VSEPVTPEQVDALSRAVERVTRRQTTHEQQLERLAVAVTEFAERSAQRDPDQAGVSWMLVSDPEAALAALADLIEWLDQVYLQYDTSLPSCWLWHPPVVEELLWLRASHATAYTGKRPSPLAAGDWHERQRPGVVKRIKDVVGGCELSQHRDGAPRAAGRALPAPLVGAAPWIVEAWCRDPAERGFPAPTELQLREAQTSDDRSAARR
jgi:hypothetical protein